MPFGWNTPLAPLVEVSRSLLFPTLEEAERYREEARAGKKKPKPRAPQLKSITPERESYHRTH